MYTDLSLQVYKLQCFNSLTTTTTHWYRVSDLFDVGIYFYGMIFFNNFGFFKFIWMMRW